MKRAQDKNQNRFDDNQSVGSSLKKLREAKGISIDEIQKATKLHSNIITALEEDRLDNINPVYAKMFIKNYCKALGVNPDDLMNSLGSIKRPKKESVVSRAPQGPSTVGIDVLAKPEAGFKKFLIPAIVLVCIIMLIYFIGVSISRRGKNTKRDSSMVTTQEDVIVEDKRPEARKLSANTSKEKAVSTNKISLTRKAKNNISTKIVLGIRPKKDVWVKVRSDDKTVFKGNLGNSDIETWKADYKIELWAGNVHNLELELNGRLLSPLGKRGKAIKHILITKNGLSIIE